LSAEINEIRVSFIDGQNDELNEHYLVRRAHHKTSHLAELISRAAKDSMYDIHRCSLHTKEYSCDPYRYHKRDNQCCAELLENPNLSSWAYLTLRVQNVACEDSRVSLI
jgi:hypothetical protein